jgi:cyclin-dependent kinase 7
VATRWYRAPELLFGARHYGPGVDLWAAGCILAELFLHRPLFPGYSDIDQLLKVLRITGTPTPESWPGAESTPDYGKILFAPMQQQQLQQLCPGMSETGVQLLEALLVLDPERRLAAAAALQHPWFAAVPRAEPPERLTVVPRRAHRERAVHEQLNSSAAALDSFEIALHTPPQDAASCNSFTVALRTVPQALSSMAPTSTAA